MKYRNQYLVVPKGTEIEPSQLDAASFEDLTIYSHSRLNVSRATSGNIQIVLLGFIINPLHPDDSNQEVIEKLAKI